MYVLVLMLTSLVCEHPGACACAYAFAFACVVRVNQPLLASNCQGLNAVILKSIVYQGKGCLSSTAGPTDGTSPTTRKVTTLTMPTKNTVPPTEPPSIKKEVNGSQTSLDLHGLVHFADYTVTVCIYFMFSSENVCAVLLGKQDFVYTSVNEAQRSTGSF